jgi:hypothetical protein
MSYLKRETIEEIQKEDWEVIKIINLIPLFNIWFSNNAKKKGDFFFIELEKFNKVTYLNKNLWNFRTKNNDLLMLAYKLSTLNSKQKYWISEEKLRSFLNLSTDNLKKYKERVRFNLNTLKENWIITDYEINSKNWVNIITW